MTENSGHMPPIYLIYSCVKIKYGYFWKLSAHREVVQKWKYKNDSLNDLIIPIFQAGGDKGKLGCGAQHSWGQAKPIRS